jgi:hypothetical protein
VDLDEIDSYHAIHGLPPPHPASAHTVYDVALDRLRSFAASAGVPLTLFAVGRDLDRPENAERLHRMRQLGHEIANHSFDHRYDLTRLSGVEIERQVLLAAEGIQRAVGARPIGFRAPGYTITDALLSALQRAGCAYDASVFPCPPYYVAKASALGMIALRGRRSCSVLDHPRVLLAPTRPYRVGSRYHRRGHGLVELPVQVTPVARLPYIGTTLTLAGPKWARWLTRLLVGEPFVNLELHGIDLLDENDGLRALRSHQPDVRVPLSRKLDVLDAVVSLLRGCGYSFVRMHEAAERVLA